MIPTNRSTVSLWIWTNERPPLSPHLKALPDPGHCCVGRRVPHCLVTEHVRRELRLGLGDAGASGAVVAVDLGGITISCLVAI